MKYHKSDSYAVKRFESEDLSDLYFNINRHTPVNIYFHQILLKNTFNLLWYKVILMQSKRKVHAFRLIHLRLPEKEENIFINFQSQFFFQSNKIVTFLNLMISFSPYFLYSNVYNHLERY